MRQRPNKEIAEMSELEALRKQRGEIGERISQIESEATRKANGGKVGKFFRCKNNYSCPEKPSDYWPVYAEVIRMDGYGWLYVNEFQTDNRGNIFIRFDDCQMHMQSSDWRRITQDQYRKAWAKMRARVTGIVK